MKKHKYLVIETPCPDRFNHVMTSFEPVFLLTHKLSKTCLEVRCFPLVVTYTISCTKDSIFAIFREEGLDLLMIV